MRLSIKDFYAVNHVDSDFDEFFYKNQYPLTKTFMKEYCDENNIDDRHRLFYHWYYSIQERYKNLNEYKKVDPSYKPPSTYLDKEVSVVVGCMNRDKMLEISIRSWLHHTPIKEIIITDWSSDNDLKYLEEIDPRIKIITVKGKEYYNASIPVNIAIKESRYPIILKLDVDYIINPYGNFNDLININKNEFICGNWKDSNIDNDLGFVKGTNGFLCAYKEDIEKVGYYDESIENYGREDDDMFKRLVDIGLHRKTLKFAANNIPIYHNPHSSQYRLDYFKEKDIRYNDKELNKIFLSPTNDGPDFIIPGFQKCGTTALRRILIENFPDEIYMPDCTHEYCNVENEFSFFYEKSKTKDLGIDWYKSLFNVQKVSGEKSPNYTINADYTARKIKKYLPHIKLIFCLRNPVDRAYSAYNHYRQQYPESKEWNWDNNKSFMDNFKEGCAFNKFGLYAEKIYQYLKYFDFKQMRFVIQERMENKDTFQEEIIKVTRFIQVPDKKLKYFKSHVRKYDRELTKEERKTISAFYASHNENLYEILGRRIPEWDDL